VDSRVHPPLLRETEHGDLFPDISSKNRIATQATPQCGSTLGLLAGQAGHLAGTAYSKPKHKLSKTRLTYRGSEAHSKVRESRRQSMRRGLGQVFGAVVNG